MNPIKVFDYFEQYKQIENEIQDAISRVLSSGHVILGDEVKKFEASFAAMLGKGGACVAVNSGTDAIAVGLRAIGIKPSDEVITVSNTAVPTISAIRSTGAIPVFCDVDYKTALMDIQKIPSLITQKTKAIIPVHLFGNVVDVPRILGLISGTQIAVLEDCAQALGATLRGALAGTMGDIGAFSFYPTKNLGAYGDAGACFSNNQDLINKMKIIRTHGFETGYHAQLEGINSRMDEIQAATLNIKLAHFPKYLQRRRDIAGMYLQCLSSGIAHVEAGDDVTHAFNLFVVKTKDRDNVKKYFDLKKINTNIHYPCPIHLMKAYNFLKYKKGDLPNSERLSREILSLPLYPELSDASVERVCKAINSMHSGQ